MSNVFYTGAEVNELLADAVAIGGAIGLLVGIAVMVFFLWLLRRTYERNFKMWLLQLNDKDREAMNKSLDDAYETFNVLSKSNTRLFKTWYNDLMRLKSYLAQKWLQN